MKFHDATDQLALELALQEVFALSTSCVLECDRLLPEYVFIREVEVGGPDPLVYDGRLVDDCVNQSGWRYTDDTRTAIELCGAACGQFQRFGELTLEFNCVE